ncbi:Hypothetical protein Ccan_20820 [Capnocytophaga canimorsus Cc5]|uniref:Uncharacterized protein n=1 Tax=Capnocytophaga canimorsus (strain 5) TaxID=860228 RepID=F9YU80_CAPCC|nr:Hypothetical protein Ccan_20820 [Capnocytophaga canimorsus Cc5]
MLKITWIKVAAESAYRIDNCCKVSYKAIVERIVISFLKKNGFLSVSSRFYF